MTGGLGERPPNWRASPPARSASGSASSATRGWSNSAPCTTRATPDDSDPPRSSNSSTRSPPGQGLRTRFLGDLAEYLQEIVVLPARNQAPSGDTLAFAGLAGLAQAYRHLAQPRQVHRACPGPVPLGILVDAVVQDPVQRVLDPSMT